jgi:uncharacterized membrane protein
MARRAVWYSPVSVWRSLIIRPKVYLAILLAIAMFAVLPAALPTALRTTVAWSTGASFYLILTFTLIWRCTADDLRKRAAREDEGAIAILLLILLTIAASLLAIVGLLSDTKSATGAAKAFDIGLAATAIVLAWSVNQMAFTLHYAHEYYAPDNEDPEGGLDFPGTGEPDYWDFLYFTTSIGAASQTADVVVRTRGLRRLVTLHAVVSFFFNTFILALTINIAASLI